MCLKNSVELAPKIADMYRKITGILKEVDENEDPDVYKKASNLHTLMEDVKEAKNTHRHLGNLSNISKETESVSKYAGGKITDMTKPAVSVHRRGRRTSSISKSSSKTARKRISTASSNIHQEIETGFKGSNDIKEVTYIVLSLNNNFKAIREYINTIIDNLEDIFGHSGANAIISVTITTSGNEQKVVASNSLSLHDTISSAIASVSEESSNGHMLMKLILKDYDKELKLTFAFMNAKESLSDLKEYVETARSRRCNAARSSESVLEVLSGVRMGYLLLIVGANECTDRLCDLLEVAQAIEESVPCLRLKDD
eukprot:TRINITY_DN4458_c0_g3_i4.p1 TRINITY_DN4458_c0_g3~~TRINITY_DN4458_c0_g3_i4.p1  ORF type:complete len:313 (+),score=65.73 TRINITY_DN4458_c0_g3_i4:131-1069(+)